MSSARSDILARVRAGLGRSAGAGLSSDAPAVLTTGERLFDAKTFAERARLAGATVVEVDGDDSASDAVRRILDELGARSVTHSGSAIARRALEGFTGTVTPSEAIEGSASREELFLCDAGVTEVQAAVAETGTLVLASDAERHRLTSLVPEVHVAIVRREQVLPTLDDVMRRFEADLPRCLTFITGPSRTADIELELVVGVHGPKALHVVLIGPVD